MKLQLQLFTATSEIEINFTAAIVTFVWQVWYCKQLFDNIFVAATFDFKSRYSPLLFLTLLYS